MAEHVIRAATDLATFAQRCWGALTAAGRRRAFRLAALILVYPILAFGAGVPIAAAWLATVATCELALTYVVRRRARAAHTQHDVGAAIAAALVANLVWAAGPLSLWLCAPELRGSAALWLAGQVFYHFVANRRSLGAFLIGAAPHGAMLLTIQAMATWGRPDFFAATAPAFLLLTMIVGAAAMRHAPQADEAAEETGPAGCVLFIGEDARARQTLETAIAPWGLTLRAFPNAQKGLTAAPSLAPALIVMDARLPDLSGWDVLAALKTAPGTAAIPAIVLSDADDRAKALSLGACEHFAKPADRTLMAAAVLRFARLNTPIAPAKPAAAPQRLAKRA